MTKYKVTLAHIEYYSLDLEIEADSQESANNIALNMDIDWRDEKPVDTDNFIN